MTSLTLFVLSSIVVALLTWQSLRHGHLHSMYRFFALECIVILLLINTHGWFSNPFAIHQIISWILLFASLLLALHGFTLLIAIGKPKVYFENTTVLVTLGAYRVIRHPLYASLILFLWGTFCKAPSLQGVLLSVVGTVFLFATAKVEELENIHRMGDEYVAYMKQTKMFIPHLL